MEKKTYLNPDMSVVEMPAQDMLATSPLGEDNYIGEDTLWDPEGGNF